MLAIRTNIGRPISSRRLKHMGIHLDFWQKTNWFSVQTKPNQEKLSAARIAKLDLEIFLPRIREERSVCSVVRTVSKALFPGYFFIRFCPLESLEVVRYTHGVLRVVGSGRFPIPVAPEIISSVQARIHPDGFVRLNAREFQPGDKVTIEQGPFEGWIGEVQREQDDGRRVMILLGAIQHARLLIEKRLLSGTASAV
jgi:transcriptional antiterminator RfaH